MKAIKVITTVRFANRSAFFNSTMIYTYNSHTEKERKITPGTRGLFHRREEN